MLGAIVEGSLRHRTIVILLAVLSLLGGFYATQRAALDVFPEFTPPKVEVQTEAPGLSAIEVEQLVTLPLEATLQGLPRLAVTRSHSIQGISEITVFFKDGTDVYRARQLAAERLGELTGTLPEGVKSPRVAPLTPTTGHLVSAGFTSSKLTPMQLRDRIFWDLRPRLLAVEGVAQIVIMGGEDRQFQVQIHSDFLAARNLTLTDVLEAAKQAGGIRGAGFIEDRNQRRTIRVEGQIRTADELGEAIIASSGGTPIRLREVATVVEGPEPKFGDASIGGVPGVVLTVYRQFEGDSSDITRRVEAEIERFRPTLEAEGIVYHPALFRQANYIELAVGNMTHALLLGAGLVVIVLFLFLFDLRTAFISLTAIPLSLLGAVLLLWGFGITLNTLTLGGLAIAVGEVVDDAIIDVENIFRRLRENAKQAAPQSPFAVVLSASLEVRGAVVYATFIVALVFVPIFFLSGLQGRLFAPLGYAYVLAVLASLLVALTVTPALCLFLLPREAATHEPFFVRWLQAGYDVLLRRIDRHLALVLVVVVILMTAAAWTIAGFGGSYLPELKENHFVVHMRGIPGTSLEQSLASGTKLSKSLHADPAIRSVAQLAGRAELGEDVFGPEYSELHVGLVPTSSAGFEKAERFLREATGQRMGFQFEIMPFLTERIKETLSGTSAAVAVKLFGDDLATLDRVAADVTRLVEQVPGAIEVMPEAQTGSPELTIRLRPADAARVGLKSGAILDALHAAYQGASVGQVYDRNRVIDVKVVLEPEARNDPFRIGQLWLNAPGGRVQLHQVADVYRNDGRFLVSHENGLRRQLVRCNVSGRDVASFAAEVERRVGEMRLPSGVTYRVTGEHEALRATQRELGVSSAAAGLGVLMLLGLALGSARELRLVLVNLPFALLGGIAAIYVTGGNLDVGGLIGFVTLFGITVRNSLMMVSHWRHLHDVEGQPWGTDLVIRGARERLVPVLMTALVTGLGLLPIALGSGEPGREVEGPMAIVILGGLATSTTLNLLVLPVMYRHWGMPESERERSLAV
jgi:CzcA family heavy metal efflux pump